MRHGSAMLLGLALAAASAATAAGADAPAPLPATNAWQGKIILPPADVDWIDNGPNGIASGPSATVVLDTKSLWRFRTVRETPELVTPSGDVLHAEVNIRDLSPFRNEAQAPQLPETAYTIEAVTNVFRLPPDTPADWMKPGFDDSAWARLRGPMLDRTGRAYRASISDEWKLILMRGLFEVRDPDGEGDLTLSLDFRGGAVVYLNGEELTRMAMPKGDLGPYTPAEPYPREVYFNAAGFAFLQVRNTPDEIVRMQKRNRTLDGFKIPAAKLAKGVNVLAVAIHRAPVYYGAYVARHAPGSAQVVSDTLWGHIGLLDIRLTAPAGATAVTGAGPLRGRGFKIWNQSIVQRIFLTDYPDPFAPLAPVRVTGVRNGTFTGQVVVGDEKPIRGLTATASELTGPGTIPAAAVRIRYAAADGRGVGRAASYFDSLEESPPAEVPVCEEHGGSIQPLWISVTVPPNARPGDYSGTISVSAEGIPSAAVPVLLRVIDWTLPDFREFTARMDLVESPESVAMAYQVPFWSDAHLKLLDRTFALMAPLAAKTLYITGVCRTHLGNEHAMVRWIRGDDGELAPDFSIAEKYLDVAVKHLGRIPGVILYNWEPAESQGHAGVRIWDKPILLTELDPETGELLAVKGPAWGTPEARALWKKYTDGIQPILRKRGLEQSIMFGLIGDSRPTKQAMDDICNAFPGAKWAIHSHLYCDKWQGYDIALCNALWGIGVQPYEPSAGYSFGWTNPFWLSYYPRGMGLGSTLVEHRIIIELWMGARRTPLRSPFIDNGHGPHGLGRVGTDFWPVLNPRSRTGGGLAGRYPESAWGQLHLDGGIPYILGRGKTGPVATVRSEAVRESLQEVEARVYLEKALLDDEAKALLGAQLLDRCRQALDERIRMALHSDREGEPWYISSGWNRRSELLFGLAGEVAQKYGGRAPKPNLTSEVKRK